MLFPTPLCEDTAKNVVVCKRGTRILTRNQGTQLLPWSWLPSPQNCENKCLSFKPYSLWYFVMAAQDRTLERWQGFVQTCGNASNLFHFPQAGPSVRLSGQLFTTAYTEFALLCLELLLLFVLFSLPKCPSQIFHFSLRGSKNLPWLALILSQTIFHCKVCFTIHLFTSHSIVSWCGFKDVGLIS